jgi:fructosamine-3-kinase
MAQLHQVHGKTSGFIDDNFIGSTPQCNSPLKKSWHHSSQCQGHSWPDFFIQRRLRFQIDLLQNRGKGCELTELFEKAENNMHALLSTAIETPSLLHGDLWSGNFLIDDQGHACLIDPAAYFGHRETDIAMTRLFGGFAPEFYQAYHDSLPLADGYNDREPIYQLYPVLNHLNLFGAAYFKQSKRILNKYI